MSGLFSKHPPNHLSSPLFIIWQIFIHISIYHDKFPFEHGFSCIFSVLACWVFIFFLFAFLFSVTEGYIAQAGLELAV